MELITGKVMRETALRHHFVWGTAELSCSTGVILVNPFWKTLCQLIYKVECVLTPALNNSTARYEPVSLERRFSDLTAPTIVLTMQILIRRVWNRAPASCTFSRSQAMSVPSAGEPHPE